MKHVIEALFPRLKQAPYSIDSPDTIVYNSVAWAMHDDRRNWDPDPFSQYFWPEPVEASDAPMDAYRRMLAARGFRETDDRSLQEGREKLALLADEGTPLHLARQLPNGMWTSKLGTLVDISHELWGLEGSSYGEIVAIFERDR